MVASLTANVYITHHAALNAIPCIYMCQTICDVTSSNVLGRLVQYEHRLYTILITERVEQGEVGCQGVKTARLCRCFKISVGLFLLLYVQKVLGNSHLTSSMQCLNPIYF